MRQMKNSKCLSHFLLVIVARFMLFAQQSFDSA